MGQDPVKELLYFLADTTVVAGVSIPLAALIVSVASLAYAGISGHRKATNEYVHQLENRLDDHETRLKTCEAARDQLMHENLALLRDLRTAPPPATVVVHTGESNHPDSPKEATP